MTSKSSEKPAVVEDATIPQDVDPYAPEENEKSPEDDTANYIAYRIPRLDDKGVMHNDERRVRMEEREAFEKEHGL